MNQFDHIVAINYAPKNPSCAGVSSAQLLGSAQFQAAVKIGYAWRGIRPDVKQMPADQGTTQQGNPKSEGGQKNNEEPKEEQSFLRKYWLYIAIPVVYLMMSKLPEEPAAGAPGGAQGGGRPGSTPLPRR